MTFNFYSEINNRKNDKYFVTLFKYKFVKFEQLYNGKNSTFLNKYNGLLLF